MISYFPSELLNLNNSGVFLPESIWSFFCSLLEYLNQPKGVVGLENMLNPIIYKSRFLDESNANIGSSMNVLTPNNSNKLTILLIILAGSTISIALIGSGIIFPKAFLMVQLISKSLNKPYLTFVLILYLGTERQSTIWCL